MSMTSISHVPTSKSYYSPLIQLPNPISLHKLPISRLPQKKRIWGQKTSMSELIRTPSVRSRDEIESFGIMGLEEEAVLSNGSSISGGFESTMNSLSKWIVAGFFGAVILWKHDAEAMWTAMGCIMNTGLSLTLKQILNQERPFSTLRSDPGMPSSHAQSIFFAVAFAILSMVKLMGLNGVTVAIGVLALASGSYLSWLRVSQRLHTISQVSVGAVVGTIFSILWFQAWYAFVLKAFIASLWVRIILVLGSVAFCVSFVIHVIRNWLTEEL